MRIPCHEFVASQCIVSTCQKYLHEVVKLQLDSSNYRFFIHSPPQGDGQPKARRSRAFFYPEFSTFSTISTIMHLHAPVQMNGPQKPELQPPSAQSPGKMEVCYKASIGIMEKSMETTMSIYWGYIGIMENKLETTIVYWGYRGS